MHPVVFTSCYILFPPPLLSTFRRIAVQSLALIQDLDLKPSIALVVERSFSRLNVDSGEWGPGGECLLSKLPWPFLLTYSPPPDAPGLYTYSSCSPTSRADCRPPLYLYCFFHSLGLSPCIWTQCTFHATPKSAVTLSKYKGLLFVCHGLITFVLFLFVS